MVVVRPEQRGDIGAIRQVVTAAFPTDAEAWLVDALRSAGKLSVSLVAVERETGIGHIAFSPVQIGEGAPGDAGVGLAPLAVAPAHQRQDAGSRLVREGLKACAHAGFGLVVVLGDPAFYGRFGFTRASAFGLANEYGVDDEFMVLELRAGAVSTCRGVVRYADEFALVE